MTTFQPMPCPSCGIAGRIPVPYLGKKVKCRHCGALVVAVTEPKVLQSAMPGAGSPQQVQGLEEAAAHVLLGDMP